MPMHDNIISFNSSAARISRRPTLTENERRTVAACRDAVERNIPHYLGGFFEKLDDALYELADKSESNALQSTYFDALREIRKGQGRIDLQFQKNVLRSFDLFWKEGPGSANPTPSQERISDDPLDPDFSLVDDDELEENLAVSNITSKGENRYQRELFSLNRRFAYLLKFEELSAADNPIGPAIFCSGFRASIRTLEVDIPVKLVIYKLFDKQVMHYIGGMYDEINSLLAKLGVLPKLAIKPRRNPVAPSVQRVTHDAAAYPNLPEGMVAETHLDADPEQANVFPALRELLGSQRSQGASYNTPHTTVVDTQELLTTLSKLQSSNVTYLSIADGSAVKTDLKGQVNNALSLRKNGIGDKSLGEIDADTLDVVAMLFDFILEDGHLHDAMRALIGRLQIPVLKVAILDKTFFSHKKHPARQFLNSLAHIAAGWTDDGDRSDSSFYNKIEQIITHVLNEFEEKPDIFEELNAQLLTDIQQDDRGAEVAEERTNQVTQGKERLKAAKQIVADELASRVKEGMSIPKVVLDLLEGGWKDVLLLNYLRQGPDSEAWLKSIDLVERLLWSVEPKTEHEDRQTLLREIPALLKELREGLDGISFDQHRTARMFKELQACHLACLRGDASVPSEADASRVSELDQIRGQDDDIQGLDVGHESVGLDLPSAGRDPALELTEKLTIGTWLDFQGEDDSSEQVKLSWRSDVTDIFVFVNRKGVKTKEMNKQTLAAAFRQGQAEIIQDMGVPLMDRALAAMMNSLKARGGLSNF